MSCHVMLYNICFIIYVMLWYITCVMCHVMLYNICHVMLYIMLYLTIIPRRRVGYEMIDSQRGA